MVKGLTKDDFTITERQQRQRIVSLEPPESDVDVNPKEDNPSGKTPVTVPVLDFLNSKFDEFAYIGYQVAEVSAGAAGRPDLTSLANGVGQRSLENGGRLYEEQGGPAVRVGSCAGGAAFQTNERFLLARAVCTIDRRAASDRSGETKAYRVGRILCGWAMADRTCLRSVYDLRISRIPERKRVTQRAFEILWSMPQPIRASKPFLKMVLLSQTFR